MSDNQKLANECLDLQQKLFLLNTMIEKEGSSARDLMKENSSLRSKAAVNAHLLALMGQVVANSSSNSGSVAGVGDHSVSASGSALSTLVDQLEQYSKSR